MRAVEILGKIARWSAGVRHRLASDVQFLGSVIYWTAVMVRDPESFLETPSGGLSLPPEILLFGLKVVAQAVNQLKKPYLKFLKSKEQTSCFLLWKL